MKKTLNVFIVSDATGATAESVLSSVLVQYKGVNFQIERFRFIKETAEIDAILTAAGRVKGIVVFTLVSGRLRDHLLNEGKRKRLILMDVMGPLIKTFKDRLKLSPKMQAGAYRRPNVDMLPLTEAIEYTLNHDDGMNLDSLDEADLIIFGVSRTGKTPASIYLSCKGLKVANVPILPDLPLPRRAIRAPCRKVGFLIDPKRLVEIRSQRVRHLDYAPMRGYVSRAAVFRELDFCKQQLNKIPLLFTIDITTRSIEETAEWITHNVL